MLSTPLLLSSYTAEQLQELFRPVIREEIRAELANFVPEAPRVVALPDYPTKRQTCAALGVTSMTLLNWSKATADRPALLVPFKVGGRLHYRREEVLTLLKNSERLRANQRQ